MILPMLELHNIFYTAATSETAILSGVSFNAVESKPVVIAGPSGSGKTSLIEVISGIAKPIKGKILWNNKILNQRERRWLCGVVFQFPERHFLGLTVAEELKLGHKRLSGEEQRKALHEVGLLGIDLRQAPEKLSGGQQRRLALAVQLLRKPKVLLLDEPTAGLDWSVRDEILDLLIKLSKKNVLIIVTHEFQLFSSWKGKGFTLEEGKLHDLRTIV